jgi:hypothetical protein
MWLPHAIKIVEEHNTRWKLFSDVLQEVNHFFHIVSHLSWYKSDPPGEFAENWQDFDGVSVSSSPTVQDRNGFG